MFQEKISSSLEHLFLNLSYNLLGNQNDGLEEFVEAVSFKKGLKVLDICLKFLPLQDKEIMQNVAGKLAGFLFLEDNNNIS